MYRLFSIIAILITCAIVAEQIYWAQVLDKLRAHLWPILVKNNLTQIPVSARLFGAATHDKARISICIKYWYSIPQLSYVLLHEYAHVLNTTYGHTDGFWHWFQTLLDSAAHFHIRVDDYFATKSYCPTTLV